MNISLTQLEYIVAVDTYRHFGLAAEKCLVTQPTLSMQLRKLEETLGVVLFDRSRQPVIPTDIGRQIIEQARVTLREARKIEEISIHQDLNASGRIKIGIIPTLAPYLLPLFVGRLMKDAPSLQLQIQELMTHEIVEQLETDQLDAGILATPLQEKHIQEIPLFYEEIQIYAQNGHPILEEKEIYPDQLPQEEMWMLSEGNCFRSQIINLCKRHVNPNEFSLQYESGSLETLRKLVDVEGGITLLPELAILDLPVRKLKQVRSFAGEKPLREVSIVHYRSIVKKGLIEKLKQHILENIPDEMKDKKRGHLVDWR